MLSLNIPSYSKPSGYQLSELPKPEISSANEVIVKVHAASINPIDVKRASGDLKAVVKDSFPFKIGYDVSGVIAETGEDVTKFQVGDAVYIRLPEINRGSCSEFVKCAEDQIGLKPPALSFEEAASIPLAGMTAIQALSKYGDLTGKTVFVPAGLSGTGLFACQLAKHVFHAGKIITTVSTAKVPKIKELLGEGTVDEIIDYTKSDPRDVIEKGSVDFLFDTVGLAMQYLCLMKPKSGHIVSVSTTPSAEVMQNSSLMRMDNKPTIPIPVRIVLNLMDSVRNFRASRYGVRYEYMILESSGTCLDELRSYVEEGKVKTVVGSTAELRDLDAVRKGCQVIFDGAGGLGKFVIKVSE
ncbi:hypothetical protein N7478_004739 [Penicillium angulare]|uniref:uncharacterized protein n=1 Tax=Penicillium angulare TaxID=116970 RepID=UPI002541B431|nr:uncharacterized protein N7478_004739 [Penicillium angulare]KAJ5279367.1 hypothetical protein N7478_004739 [Penicillium angulare]